MNQNDLNKIIPSALAGVALLSLLIWLWPKHLDLNRRLPGQDRQEGAVAATIPEGVPEGTLTKGPGMATENIDESWPWFRNTHHNGIYRNESIALSRDWPAAGPPALWEIEIGEGHAGATFHQGRIYLLDYDRENEADVLRCISPADGSDIWRYAYPIKVKRNHGMSRTVPAVTDKHVVSLGPKGHVICLDAVTGEYLWGINLVSEYGTRIPLWYAGQCPLIDGERVIIAPGGPEALLLAVEIATGEPVWQTPNPREWEMTHSSILPTTLAGTKTFVYCASGGVVGVAAEDGELLWETDQWKISIATVPTPVAIDEQRIFLSGGYNAGSMMLRINRENNTFSPEVAFQLPPKIFGAAQHTPIYHDGHIYGIRPDEQFVCLDLDGTIVWTSGSDCKFGIGPFLLANNIFYAMDDHGLLRMFSATPQAYRQLGEAKVLEGPDSWGPMAMANGLLVLRDLNIMKCLDMRK